MDSMTPIAEFARELWHDESGQDLVEYALLLVLIALAAVTLIRGVGDEVKAVFSEAKTELGNETN